jgi:hypothetical protein
MDLERKVIEDFEAKAGPYSVYSSSYYLTRFRADVSALVRKGILQEVSGTLQIPTEYQELIDRITSTQFVTGANIPHDLGQMIQHERALELEVIRLIAEGSRDPSSHLQKLGWSQKAIAAALIELSNQRIISTYPYKFASREIEEVVRTFLNEHMRAVTELTLDKKDESERLSMTIPPGQAKSLAINRPGLMEVLLDFAEECKGKGIEVLSSGLGHVRVVFSRRLYDISLTEQKPGSIPYTDADRALIVCAGVAPEFIKNYWEEYNDSNRKATALYDLDKQEIYRVSSDSLFDLFERFVASRFGVAPRISMTAIENGQEILSVTRQMLKTEKDEGAKRLPYEEGFATTLPNLPFSLGTELQSAFQTSKNTIKVCCPYFDNSTFDLLGTVPSNARIIVVCTYDEQLKRKISAGKLTATHVRKTLEKGRIEVRRIEDLHARFVIVDDGVALFLSPDIKTEALMSKFQYLHWTNNPEIVRNAVDYFDLIWKNAEQYDILRDLEGEEKQE